MKNRLLKNGGGGSEAWSKREAVWNINEKKKKKRRKINSDDIGKPTGGRRGNPS